MNNNLVKFYRFIFSTKIFLNSYFYAFYSLKKIAFYCILKLVYCRKQIRSIYYIEVSQKWTIKLSKVIGKIKNPIVNCSKVITIFVYFHETINTCIKKKKFLKLKFLFVRLGQVSEFFFTDKIKDILKILLFARFNLQDYSKKRKNTSKQIIF